MQRFPLLFEEVIYLFLKISGKIPGDNILSCGGYIPYVEEGEGEPSDWGHKRDEKIAMDSLTLRRSERGEPILESPLGEI